MPLFGEAERAAALARALELLEADARIEAVVLAGSVGSQTKDRWSDMDIDAVISAGISAEQVASDWVSLAYREWPVVHHYETSFGSSIVRGFLLENGVVLDFGFDPVEDFSVWAPVRVAFDRTGTATRAAEAPEAWTPTPDWRGESGFAWHDVLHACSAAARGRAWQSLYFIQLVRNRTLGLACERHGLDADEFKHADELPAEARTRCSPASSRTWPRRACWLPSPPRPAPSWTSCAAESRSSRTASASRCSATWKRPGMRYRGRGAAANRAGPAISLVRLTGRTDSPRPAAPPTAQSLEAHPPDETTG